MKKCPYCAEEIQEEALKCRFCHEFLDGSGKESPARKSQWYFKTSTLVVGFLIVGPFILPLVWFHPSLSKAAKWGVSVLILVLSFMLAKATIASWNSISQYYGAVSGDY